MSSRTKSDTERAKIAKRSVEKVRKGATMQSALNSMVRPKSRTAQPAGTRKSKKY